MKNFVSRLWNRLGPALQSDIEFIETAYRKVLGRPPDRAGVAHYRAALRNGLGRTDLLIALVHSEEYTAKLTGAPRAQTDPRTLRPDQYRDMIDRTNGHVIGVFEIENATDFDWLETRILKDRYYEKPGVWNLDIDTDKRDVFEHLNPNRLDAYLARMFQITADGGFAFCNIPAIGSDPVFGTVFPYYIDGWEADAAAGRPFSRLHVDGKGYPIHGHLTWADVRWWAERFERAGFSREPEIEQRFHAKYDDYMTRMTPARRAYYVFSKGASTQNRRAIVERITSQPSRALAHMA